VCSFCAQIINMFAYWHFDQQRTAVTLSVPNTYMWCEFKTFLIIIATLTYRALQSRSPSYLSSLIKLNNPPRPLRSASLSLLHVPFTAKAVGRKAFSFAAPTIWNSIPQNIRLLPSIGSFKRSLKTHLFPTLASHVPHLAIRQRLWLELAWICALYKFCNNNNNNNKCCTDVKNFENLPTFGKVMNE